METTIANTSEFRELPLALLTESPTNPRRSFDEAFLNELAATIRTNGVLSPLLVRPKNERSFEIVFGAQRYRAAQIAEVATVSVRIKNMTDAEVLEAQLIENLQRRDVHPMEEARGFKALLDLEQPKYSIEQIAAKTGKSPAYIAQRLKLTELSAAAVEAFYADEIGVGHALLLAKLPADQQEEALKECFQEEWSASRDRKAKRILLPVRHLQVWIEQNVLLLLKDAPFDKRDAHLVAIAGSCVDCPQRTGYNKQLFADLGKQDACTNPSCFQAKVDAHIAATLAAKPKLVQSARPTTSRRREASFCRVTSTLRFRTKNQRTKNSHSDRNTRRASSQPRPSLPKGAGREQLTRSAPIPIAPFIILRSKPAGRMRGGGPNRKKNDARLQLQTRRVSVSSRPSARPFQYG